MSIASPNMLRLKSRKAHVHRLYPTEEQSVRSGPWVGAVRFVYNLALDHRRTFGRKGRSITYNVQAKGLTALWAEIDWIRDASVCPLHQGRRDLDRTYDDWWKGPASAPTRRTRVVNDTMRFPDPSAFAFRRLSRQTGEMTLLKIGGIWLRWEREVFEPKPSALPAIRICLGVTNFAAMSDRHSGFWPAADGWGGAAPEAGTAQAVKEEKGI